MWLIIAKAAILFLVVHVAIELLSRVAWSNHRRGWALVGVVTVAGAGLAAW